MERLTDRKTAADLKRNCDNLQAKGIEPNISDLRYIKLAEYENAEEFIEMVTHAPVLSYQTAAIKEAIENGKRKVYFVTNAMKTMCDELASYAIGEDPQELLKWPKENPALTSFKKQQFVKRGE